MKKDKLNIRSLSWGRANISWSVVIEYLLHEMEKLDNNVVFHSTNGYQGMKYWDSDKAAQQALLEKELLAQGKVFDIDLTYTVPQNFPQRFLRNSKKKMAIYAYESSIMPKHWEKFYHVADYVLPPSEYVAEMMKRNGCPEDKIVVVPHGVDTEIFHPDVEPLELSTKKNFKFLCVSEPHYRKQLDKMLDIYCKTFTADDDVSFILKTKIFKPGEEIKGFEQDLRVVISKLKKKYGPKMPEIKIITKRLDDIATLFAACDAFALMTASEGWGMPYLEALAMGMPVIAPRHGGQLQFLNDDNAILTKCSTRLARRQEQYWMPHAKARVGNPNEADFAEKMMYVYKNQNLVRDKYREAALKTAQKFTWANAAQQILDLA